jgi:DNA-binding response OmpR family regulator
LTTNNKPTRVVVIDDDHTTIELLKTILEPNKFTVIGADSSIGGIVSAHQFDPDVIIIDYLSPKNSGLNICREIRSRSNVPIVVLSAVNKTGVLERTLNAGADEYLIKPVPANILIAHLKTLSRRYQQERNAKYRKIGTATKMTNDI